MLAFPQKIIIELILSLLNEIERMFNLMITKLREKEKNTRD